jgi:hypothetical protein
VSRASRRIATCPLVLPITREPVDSRVAAAANAGDDSDRPVARREALQVVFVSIQDEGA